MKEKIIQLRKIVPIPMGEAIQLLKEYNGDIEKVAEVFREKSIEQICQLTNANRDLVASYYEKEMYDFNRTVSFVNDELYDRNYQPILGLTKEDIRSVLSWVSFIEQKDFATSLTYMDIEKVIYTLSLIPELKDVAQLLRRVKDVESFIFEGYNDNLPLEDFVRRHKLLDDNESFQRANQSIPLRLTVIKEELLRHLRNL